MARNDQVSPDREDMRKDLLAAMAAARELGPEMDSSLADAHLRRHFGEQPQRAVQPRPRADVAPFNPAYVLGPLMAVLCIAAFVSVLFFTQGGGWWLFWPLMIFGFGGFGWRRGGWGGRYYGRRYDRRWDRYGRRDGDGYHGDDPHYVSYDAPGQMSARPAHGDLI
ncbi:MAG TPA: hypothetical protein VGR57_03940 [Ktedonobacterales bacterium]|nr:hypothetical protein [Ktedonobacterales bacterium]